MAAMGDRNALNYTRAEAVRPAQKGDELKLFQAVCRRSSAIFWLGMSHDKESVPLLQSCTTATDVEIREASKKSLVMIGR